MANFCSHSENTHSRYPLQCHIEGCNVQQYEHYIVHNNYLHNIDRLAYPLVVSVFEHLRDFDTSMRFFWMQYYDTVNDRIVVLIRVRNIAYPLWLPFVTHYIAGDDKSEPKDVIDSIEKRKRDVLVIKPGQQGVNEYYWFNSRKRDIMHEFPSRSLMDLLYDRYVLASTKLLVSLETIIEMQTNPVLSSYSNV